jgi:hypothetical protein
VLAAGLILKLSRLQKLSWHGSILKVQVNGTDLSRYKNRLNYEKLLASLAKNILGFSEIWNLWIYEGWYVQ